VSADVRTRNRRRSAKKVTSAERPTPPDSRPKRPSVLLPKTSSGRLALGAILLVAFALRAYNLTGMFPVLVDESIYLRWAEIIHHQGQWFVSLLDGKPPLQYWLLALTRFLGGDGAPLFWGRFLAVLAGLGSTVGVFAVARRLQPGGTDDKTGLVAAGLYALFPWALLYDRLAYTEAWTNFFGIALTLAALLAFERDRGSWKGEILAGLVFGLGLFTKQTVILFGLVPLAAAWFFARKHKRNWMLRLAVVYALALLFVGINRVATPEAPMLETHDSVLHHTGFFASPDDLKEDPLVAARSNFPKLVSYIGTYLTWPLALAALASAAWLFRAGSFAPWLLVAASLVPAVVEAFLLELMFPTRYPFPHFWPWLAVAAAGMVAAWRKLPERFPSEGTHKALAAVAAVVLLGPVAFRAGSMLAAPREGLHVSDVEGFLGDHPHVGYGIREAVEFLEAQATQGPFVVLTTPNWGPPGDAIFPYLNEKRGIRVYDAWWMQLSPDHPILPPGEAAVLRSQYERIEAGKVDFRRVPRVFYVADTHYMPPPAVQARQPNAQRVASFPKRNGHAIDVYQLK